MEEKHLVKDNKKKRVFSFCIAIIFILCTAMPLIAKANSDIPQFDISISANPQSANIGQDIVVSGTIIPKDFTAEVKPKDVVLVLDISGSMQDKIKKICDGNCYYCNECRKYLSMSLDEHKNEKPYSNHQCGWNWYYGRQYPWCNTCDKFINSEQEHKNENPYLNHNLIIETKIPNGNYKHDSYTTKICELKKAAKNFVDSLTLTDDKKVNVKNLNIGIVSYNNYGYIDSDLVEVTDIDNVNYENIEKLKKSIDELTANGGTNTGDGLRRGAYLLDKSKSNVDKTFIFMSDGYPTYYSYYLDYWNSEGYYKTLDNENPNIGGSGYSDDRGYCLEYAQVIGNSIKYKNYNVFSIGYGLGDENSASNKKMKEIHQSMGGKSFGDQSTFFPTDEGAIDGVFKKIADKISSTATDVKLNLDLPPGIEIIGNQQVIPLDNIVYKEASRYKNIVTYHAEPIKFNFIIRGNTAGNFNLLRNAKITFMWDGKKKEVQVKELNVTIIDPRKPKVIIKASDSAKIIDYDSSIKEENTDENYKLYGKSNLRVDAVGVDTKYLRYRFNKNQDTSSNKWKYIELNQENDIDKMKENYLTQMPYDVSKMPLRANEEMWNNRNNVFKEPFLKEITQISTKVSNGREYVQKEESEKENGDKVTRWKPKTLFVENYDVSSYAPDYKEASKSWGYMTVPEDGEYTFKAVTDDGFYGNITVDGESKVIGDAFRVKWYKDQPEVSKPIKLKKDKYYPVYFEYFNWGGSACYKIECRKNSYRESDYKEVSERGIKFYPSKSSLPILDANNGFMGSKIIDMPSEFGKYIFEYELVDYGDDEHDNNENKGNGTFGVFEVEERFILNKYFSKNGEKIGSKLEIANNESFEIKYEVKPKDILISELYKGKNSNNSPDSLYIKHNSLEDILPDGLYTKIIVDENNVKKEKITTDINLSKDSLEYKLDGDKYVADPYVFTVKIECRPNVSKKINFKKSGALGYRDVSLKDDYRISLNQYFDEELTLNIKGESEIIKHGVVIDGSIKDPNYDKSEFDNLVFKKNVPYTLGFIIDAKGYNNNFTLNAQNAYISNMFIYELNSEGKIIDSSKKEIKDISSIGIKGNNIGSYIKQGKKYAVVYYAKLKNDIGRAEFIAKLDSGSSKNLILNFDGNLPELF